MRVFVLGTGRCGTLTFARACTHLTNFTAGHETRSQLIGAQRFAYPDQHVEADNRLSWFLGGLAQRFGDAPLYVHLRRDPEAVAQSLARRWSFKVPGILIRAFGSSIVMRGNGWPVERRLEVSRFYVETVTANVEAFLVDKPRTMTIWIEAAADAFPAFWERIGGRGDLEAALGELRIHHNAHVP